MVQEGIRIMTFKYATAVIAAVAGGPSVSPFGGE
jgi:hypothetical protein